MVIVYLDDISRYIVALGEFKEATPENAIDVLKKAESVAEYFSSTICTINMDRESQFYTEDKKGNDKFEEYLEKKGIEVIYGTSGKRTKIIYLRMGFEIIDELDIEGEILYLIRYNFIKS